MKAIGLFLGIMLYPIAICAQEEPSVITSKVSEVSYKHARVLASTKGAGISERGICYSLSPNKNLPEQYIKFGTGSFGGYSTELTGLSPRTTYYVRAYAICGNKYCYGKELKFTTEAMPLPEVNTLSCSEITKRTARIQGKVSGPEILECGAFVSENPEEVPQGKIHKLGSKGFGNYSLKLTNLSPATKYYACFYARNNAGISCGKIISFTTQN
jgi:hypothetical protein